jgi:hypothetical protein
MKSKTAPDPALLTLGRWPSRTAWSKTHLDFWSLGQTGMTNEYGRVFAGRDSTRLAMSLMFIVHGRGGQLRDLAG